jgi:hypothetical protein
MRLERKRPRLGAVIGEFGAGSRNRTHDQRFTKPLLYQLSYAGPGETPRHPRAHVDRCQLLFYDLQVLGSVARLGVGRSDVR